MAKHLYYNVVIAGCGVAGLYTALNLPSETRILMLCKEDLESCDSMLAQGGICVLHDEQDYDSFFEDTMKAGHYENRKESVDIMIRSSRQIIDHLLELGVRFDSNPDVYNIQEKARTPGPESASTRISPERRSRRLYKGTCARCRM